MFWNVCQSKFPICKEDFVRQNFRFKFQGIRYFRESDSETLTSETLTALREAVNEVRKQKWEMRRTRAAERAIFDTAEMEKLAQVQGFRQPSFDQMIEGPHTKKMKMD